MAQLWGIMKLLDKWPFMNKQIYALHDKQVIWLARLQRKGLFFNERIRDEANAPFWLTQSYNEQIGKTFAIGAFLFGLASIMMFCAITWPQLSNLTNLIFFAGSIPFTLAASLQHVQSANMREPHKNQQSDERQVRFALIGWHPRSAGWWSTLSQWIGTLAFNIDTFNSIAAPQSPMLTTLEIWAPNFSGSVFFLISGYLAFIEVGNNYWSWQPKNLSWQTVFINLLGCIAFMISAVMPVTPSPGHDGWVWEYSNSYTLLGAIFFFIGALLLVKESRDASST